MLTPNSVYPFQTLTRDQFKQLAKRGLVIRSANLGGFMFFNTHTQRYDWYYHPDLSGPQFMELYKSNRLERCRLARIFGAWDNFEQGSTFTVINPPTVKILKARHVNSR